MKKLLVIGGATASGKTDFALGIAQRLGAELVGADSVQIHRELNIGSAKPSPDELASIPHHLLDVLAPTETIDAARYAALADEAIASVHGAGRLPIVVGGTGLWIRALLKGLLEAPPVDYALRASLERRADEEGPASLHAELAKVDTRAAQTIHPNDKLRIVRALEIYRQTGVPMGELRDQHRLGQARYDYLFVVVSREKELLHRRIAERVDRMIAAGFEREVRELVERYGAELRALGSVGYSQMRDHIVHGIPLETTIESIARATRLYAKRQNTWFNGEKAVTIRVALAGGAIQEQVDTFLAEHVLPWLQT